MYSPFPYKPGYWTSFQKDQSINISDLQYIPWNMKSCEMTAEYEKKKCFIDRRELIPNVMKSV